MTEEPKSGIDSDSLKYILSMPKGRKVIWDILAIAGLYKQPYVPGNSDGTSFSCGSLNVGLAIYADCLLTSPDLTAMMTKEQGNADRELADHSSDTGNPNDSGTRREQPDPDLEPQLPFSRWNTDLVGD
jgi:hypothetical protein